VKVKLKYLDYLFILLLTLILLLTAITPLIFAAEFTSGEQSQVLEIPQPMEVPWEIVSSPDNPLQSALDLSHYLESSYSAKLVGDKGQAIGPLQIHRQLVDDVNRIIGQRRFNYQDRWSLEKSQEMFEIYSSYYGQRYIQTTGQKPTTRTYVRMWNGGPDGWRKNSTLAHWARAKN